MKFVIIFHFPSHKITNYTWSNLLKFCRVNDRGVYDILIYFQEKVWNFENKFGVATNNITNYTYSKFLNSCCMTKLKHRSQTFYYTTCWLIGIVNEQTFHAPVNNIKNIHIPNCSIVVEWRDLNFVLKLFYYSSWLNERANDRGVHGILIHFQEKVWNFENKFGLATHNNAKCTYS